MATYNPNDLTPTEKEQVRSLMASGDTAGARELGMKFIDTRNANKAQMAAEAQSVSSANQVALGIDGTTIKPTYSAPAQTPSAPANAPITVNANKEVIAGNNAPTSGMVAPSPAPVAPTNADADWNARQKAFDALNPAGTKESYVNRNVTQEQVAAAKESMTFRPTVAPTPAPTTTETPKPTTAPAKTGVNYDTSVGREAEIQSNLKRISGENPALLTDRAKFDQAFGYSTADAGKKALLDSFFEGSQPKSQSPDDVFALLRSGRTAFDQATMKSGAYQTALKRFQDFNRYSGYNASQLATAISSGDLIQGSQAYNDLYADPKIRANLDYARSFIITKGVDLAKTGEKKTEEIISNNPNTASAFADGVITADEYKAMISSPEIEGKRKDVEAKKNEYDKLKAQYDAIDDEVDNELKGTGATSSYAAALKAQRRKGIYKDLQIASDTYNNAVGTLADLTKTQAGLVEMNLGLYKEQQAFAKQKELAKYNQELALETSKKKFEQELAQKTQMASDPVLATQDVIDQYRKLGIMAQRSDAEIIASVKNDIASGMTLGQSLTNLNKAFQSKPEYKAKMAGKAEYKEYGGQLYKVDATTGELTPVSAPSVPTSAPVSVTGGSFDLRDSASKYPNEASLKNNNPAGITYNDTFAQTLRNSGVQFSIGTARPKAEGGNYFSFPNVEEGFKAYDILWSSPRYQNLTVGQALARWGTGALPGVNTSKKVSDLSEGELEQLQAAQLRKESPGMYKELVARGILTAEGRDFTRGAETKPEQGKYSGVQMAAMDEYIQNPSAKDADAKIAKFGLRQSDVNAYVIEKAKEKAKKDVSSATEKPLGADAGKMVAYTTTGIELADKISKTLSGMSARDFTLKVKAGDPVVYNDIRLLADSIIRLRTGAAATAQEVDTFAGGLSGWFNVLYNDKNAIQQVINTYKNELNNARRSVTESASSVINNPSVAPMSTSVPQASGSSNPLGLNLPGF